MGNKIPRKPAGILVSITVLERNQWTALVNTILRLHFFVVKLCTSTLQGKNDLFIDLFYTFYFYFVIIASPVSGKMGPTGSVTGSPKSINPGLVPKQERTPGTGSILNLNLGQYHKTKHVLYLCHYNS